MPIAVLLPPVCGYNILVKVVKELMKIRKRYLPSDGAVTLLPHSVPCNRFDNRDLSRRQLIPPLLRNRFLNCLHDVHISRVELGVRRLHMIVHEGIRIGYTQKRANPPEVIFWLYNKILDKLGVKSKG